MLDIFYVERKIIDEKSKVIHKETGYTSDNFNEVQAHFLRQYKKDKFLYESMLSMFSTHEGTAWFGHWEYHFSINGREVIGGIRKGTDDCEFPPEWDINMVYKPRG